VFSRRSGRDQSPNALAQLALQVGKPRFDLTSSNPTCAGLSYPAAWLESLERAQAESLVYRPEPFGWLPAREALASLCGESAEDILLSASTSEAYAFLFKLLCDPGDAVLVPAPSYPLFEHLAELEGVQVRPYRVAYDGAWHLDVDSVRRAITLQTRAIVLVSPNNPTGNYVRAEELTALAGLGLPLIIDEVFAPFALSKPRPSASKPNDVLAFSLDGLSKRAGSPQLKLGWTVISGPAPLRAQARARLELIADTFLSFSTPIQRALPDLLRHAPVVADAINLRCRENLTTLRQIVQGSPLTLLEPEAGWSAPLHLPAVASEEEWALGLLRDGVLVQPGYFYDFEREPYAIVSLLTEPRTFSEGTARLVELVKRVVDG
jgi:alanine-synthesizing transaminase